MPKFNVIRVHHYHLVKVRSMRMGLHEDDLIKDKEEGVNYKSFNSFQKWRRGLIKSLNNKKPLSAYKIEHLYHEDAVN